MKIMMLVTCLLILGACATSDPYAQCNQYQDQGAKQQCVQNTRQALMNYYQRQMQINNQTFKQPQQSAYNYQLPKTEAVQSQSQCNPNGVGGYNCNTKSYLQNK